VFHDDRVDAVWLLKLASRLGRQSANPWSYRRLEAYSFLGVIRKGIGWKLRLGAEAQAYFPVGYSLPNPSVARTDWPPLA
jgi:hypothetical protein